ncbi:AMP-binding protein [Aquihabitans sp. McL0605]|uniref:AMP-binding protein n=1 Tax=Aquihabitans sp. McL0605 TaxID=3415671 RepID=UPI003CF704AE
MTPWAAHLPPGLAPDDVHLLAAASLPGSWTARWAADPAHPTVHDDREGWITADELEHRSRAVAGRLAHAGLVPGERVLISAAASVELVVAHVAAIRLGLVVIPANTGYLEREVAHIVTDAAPSLAVVDDEERGRWIAAAAGDREVLVVGTDVAIPDGPDPAWLDGVGSDDPAILAYTSGTTGSPKGALLSHGNLLSSAEALRLAWRWSPDDRLVLPLPLFHMHGLGVGLHGTLTAGASVVLRRGFEVADTLGAIGEHQATLFFGVPTMWSRLASSGRLDELRALRLGVSGSAPLAAALHEEITAGSGQRLIERYGMTETVMNVSNPYDGDRRPGTVGLPLPGVDLRLAEGTDEILLQGPNVFSGYWQRPEATAETFVDGWFATGDVGALDGDGYLRIVGRRKELIISGGYNVYPREVEDVLRAHGDVIDVAVVGLPHPDWGEQVIAVVEGAPGPTSEADLLALATAGLAAYKRPKRVVFVEALPRNALGKVVKGDVVDQVR